MKRFMIPVTVALLAVPTLAPAKGNGHGNGNGHKVTASGPASACPPGLAKKSPACVPPGLAKKQYSDNYDGDDRYIRVGDRIVRDYVVIRDPSVYGLDPYSTYYRYGGNVYQVDRDTREVLALIGAVSAILN